MKSFLNNIWVWVVSASVGEKNKPQHFPHTFNGKKTILLPGLTHPGGTTRASCSLKFIRIVSGETKEAAGLKKLLWPYCPSHNTLKFPTKLNNVHTISFTLPSFLSLILWLLLAVLGSSASLWLRSLLGGTTQQRPLRWSVTRCHPFLQIQGGMWALASWGWWLQACCSGYWIHYLWKILRESWGGKKEQRRQEACRIPQVQYIMATNLQKIIW